LRARQGGLDPLKTKIHPRRKPEDAKFEDSRGFIIDPTVDAESGQLEEASTDRRRSEMRGDPEINPSAAAKGSGLEGERRSIIRRKQGEATVEGELGLVA
jgi:hypothetical protein